MGGGKLLLTTQSPDGDSPTAAAESARLLSSPPSKIQILDAPSKASQTDTRPAIPSDPVSSLHQRSAWQNQTQVGTGHSSGSSSSSGSVGVFTFGSTTFIVSLLFLLPITFFTIATVLDLEILVSSSERRFTPLDFMPLSNFSRASWGRVGVRGLPVDGNPWTSEEAEACSRGVLKVFVYDIPQAFSAGLMSRDFEKTESESNAALRTHEAVPMLSELADIPHWQDGRVYWKGVPAPSKSIGTSWNEYTAEHYLTADILTPPQERDNRSRAIRVMDPQEADVFFLPLYATCMEHWNFRKDIYQGAQIWVLNFLLNSPWWHRNGGSDHVIPVSNAVTLKLVRKYLSNAIFIVTDFWTFPSFVSNVTKDVVTPYSHLQPYFSEEDELRRLWNVTGFSGRAESPGTDPQQKQRRRLKRKKVAAPVASKKQRQKQHEGKKAAAPVASTAAPVAAASLWSLRDILVYFRGFLKRRDRGMVRGRLQEVLRDEPGVVFIGSKSTSHEVTDSMAELRRSKFCLHLAGDTPSSCRFFDAIASGCVPIVISDSLDLPFESTIDYSDMAVSVAEKDALKKGYLMNLVRNITEQEWTNMQTKMRGIWHHLEFHQPSIAEDAVDMIWRDVKLRRCKWYGNLFENKNKRLKQAKLL